MHPSALEAGKTFFQVYCPKQSFRVLDVGAMDVNGSLRSVAPQTCRYVGADLAPGKGVDVVLDSPHAFPFRDEEFDAVVSTSCFEHDPFFWLTFLECIRVLKVGAYFYLNVPSNGIYHAYPTDNWRFYPDAGLALAQWGRLQGLRVEVAESFVLNQIADHWNDFVCVFERCAPDQGPRALTSSIHAHFSAATNIWLPGAAHVLRHEILPEDLRKLRAAYLSKLTPAAR